MASSRSLSLEGSSFTPEGSRESEDSSSATDICHVFDVSRSFELGRNLHTGDERENAFGAGYSPNVLRDHLDFWNTLSKSEKEMFVRSTEAIPMDAMGGLMEPGKVLYRRKRWSFPLFVNLVRIALNLYVTLSTVYRFNENDGRVIFGRHSLYTTELFRDHVTVCDYGGSGYRTISNASSTGEPNEWAPCVQHSLKRVSALRIISWSECVILVLMVIRLLIGWLPYLLLHNGSNAPYHKPATFLFLPKLASKFSAVSFLQLLNLSRFRALVERGEGTLLWTLFWRDLIPYGGSECGEGDPYDGYRRPGQDPEGDHDDDNHEESMLCRQKKFRDGCLHYSFIVVLHLGTITAIAVGFQALLAKLTEIHFVTVTSFHSWGPHDWLMALGFMNQMAGMCWVDEIEFARIMLFKFGGSDSMWTWQKSRTCAAYLRMVVRKLAGQDGYLHRYHHKHYRWFPETWHRIKAIGVMANIDASGLQLILQSRTRENYLSKRQMETLRRFEAYYDDKAMAGTDDLVSPEECKKHKEHCETLFRKEWEDEGLVFLHSVEQKGAEKIFRLAESLELVERWIDAIPRAERHLSQHSLNIS